MKRISMAVCAAAILILCLGFSACSRPAEDVSSSAESTPSSALIPVPEEDGMSTVRELDAAFNAKYETAEATLDMVSVCERYGKEWMTLADQYYDILRRNAKATDPAMYEYLADLKAGWEKNYESNCADKQEQLRAAYSDGSMFQIEYAYYQCDQKRCWAVDLIALYGENTGK